MDEDSRQWRDNSGGEGVDIIIHPIFLLARQSHQPPRIVTAPVLQLVGFVRVHFLYLNPNICKCQIFSADILYSSCKK
jgi:hypothetical protein